MARYRPRKVRTPSGLGVQLLGPHESAYGVTHARRVRLVVRIVNITVKVTRVSRVTGL